MFEFQQGSPKHKSIPEFIYKMTNQIKALSMETNKELKMKYWIDRIKVKQCSSFPLLGGRNCTHKNINRVKLEINLNPFFSKDALK